MYNFYIKKTLQYEVFSKIVNTKSIDIMVGNYSRHINNTHELLGNTQGVYGVKTGFTGNAGRCLITAVKRGNLDIIIVVLGAETKNIRTLDTQKIINYIFDNYEMVDTYELIQKYFNKEYLINNVKISKSVDKLSVGLEKIDRYMFPVKKSDINQIKINIYHLSLVEAPLSSGIKIGELRVIVDYKILYSLDIKLTDNISKKNYKNYMFELLYDIKQCF